MLKDQEKDQDLEQIKQSLKPILVQKSISEAVEGESKEKTDEDNMIAFSEYQVSSNQHEYEEWRLVHFI